MPKKTGENQRMLAIYLALEGIITLLVLGKNPFAPNLNEALLEDVIMPILVIAQWQSYGAENVNRKFAAPQFMMLASFGGGVVFAYLVGVREFLPLLLGGASLLGAVASLLAFKAHKLSPGGLAAQKVAVEVSVKPFIWLLWFACLLITFGCVLQCRPRRYKSRSESQ